MYIYIYPHARHVCIRLGTSVNINAYAYARKHFVTI